VKRRFRLTKSADYKRVRRFGKSFAHPLAVLVVLPVEKRQEEVRLSRFAVSAGRSVGNAVERNRAKRLLRAAIQPLIPSILPGWDILLIARRPLARVKCQDAQKALIVLLKRANLLKESQDG
jgi:ribonuclease P protein component